MRSILTIIGFLLSMSVVGQSLHQKVQQVIIKNKINHQYSFGRWTRNGGEESHIRYLGHVKTENGITIKLVTNTFYWGLGPRASSDIIVCDIDNNFIGHYKVTTINDLPAKMENGKLIFVKIVDSDCNKNLTDTIDFSRSIPDSIFLRCVGDNGYLYNFEKTKKNEL